MTKITEHFTLEELTYTSLSGLKDKNLEYGKELQETLYALCLRILEPARELLGCPLLISSGIRCPALNEAMGGSILSQHMLGEAADFAPRGKSVVWAYNQLAAAKNKIKFGQLIHEISPQGKEWIHISLGGMPWRPEAKSGQILVIDKRVKK
jgi:hypothetical protein